MPSGIVQSDVHTYQAMHSSMCYNNTYIRIAYVCIYYKMENQLAFTMQICTDVKKDLATVCMNLCKLRKLILKI